MARTPITQKVQGSLLLTAKDVAEMIGYGVPWVLEQTRKKRIPHVRIGRYPRYRREAIEQWVMDREHAGGL
jgi:excisionase family DNA binding protein